MRTLQLFSIQIAIALLLLTQAKSTTIEEISVHPNNTTTSCIADERSALVTFRAGLSDPANRLSSWKGDDCCRWKGVHCSNKTGHVIRLDLQGPDCSYREISRQGLGGNISSSLLGLQRLRYLDLSCNMFENLQIPEFLGSLHNLRYIELSQSSIFGRIPPQLGNLSNLRYLSLGSNFGDTYSNDITWLSRLGSLEHLDMGFVDLSTVTNWLPVVNMLPSLKVLCLYFCQLTSSPDSLQLSNLTSLEELDLSFNYFTKRGSPNWFWDLTSLKYLDFSFNGFYGPFPDEIEELTKIDNLQYLDLAYNNITGSIPRSIGNWRRMILTRDDDDFEGAFWYDDKTGDTVGDTVLRDYSENFTIVTKGQERLYTGEIIYMVNLDLSCNNLVGDIPEEIATLIALKSLNLSWNAFSGKIPEKIGALVQVESLDLSHNELSGEIPTSLSALTSLSRLNMSYNNLTGVVPSGNQLQALEDPSYIYIGNPGLCGPPLPRNCSQLEPIPATQELHEDTRDVASFFIAMGSGYVFALWVVFCTFLFKRKWRVSWFSYCDSLYDRIYVLVAVTWAILTRRNA
uniref:Uncharacterized protein n=1 Tax=Avena sativa TaxID=4498 RepID=A0ACD5VCB3_AVESA